jgi:hypothetical protein
VSKAGFNFNQIRIIYFCPASLKERKMLWIYVTTKNGQLIGMGWKDESRK